MKLKWLFTALAVLILVTGMFGGMINVPQASAASAESNTADKIEPSLQSKLQLEGMADFIVRFNEQVDLSPAYTMDWEARGQFVYNTLNETAALSQARAKGMLNAAGLEYQTFIAGNELYVWSGSLDVANSLAALDEVFYIRATRTFYIDPVVIENPLANVKWSGELLSLNLTADIDSPAALAWGISYTKADQFWTAFGVQGDGVTVANIDTGVQYNHPALDQSYGCVGDPGNAACWLDPSDICPGDLPCDNSGHGSHTMGTMVGDDDPSLTWQAGMAPNSTWIACKGCESSSCSEFALNSCADWILAPGGDPNNRPDVVNNSWGGGGGDTWYLAKVNAWRAAGTYPAFSAGNNGSGCSTLGSPGDYQESFGSAAHDSAGNIASFSSRGPSLEFGHDPYTKPNISAPGVSVCSSVPTDAWSCGYSGTSMASPHSAGAVALLWSCNPSLVGQIDMTFELLQDNANNATPDGNCGAPPDGEGNYTYGYGYLDILAAGIVGCGDIYTGTLEGYVVDNNSNPIQGATVSAQPATKGAGIQATTDPNGYYNMDLVVGTYDVTAFKTNYTTQTQYDIDIITGTTTTLPDFVLTFLGAWTQLDPLPGCPDWTRYDGEYSNATGMVYFMGGRYDTSTIPDIYELDPGLGQCTDTGTDMITGISNYQIVPMNIDGADVLCTFGGRDPTGANTDDVQCYDPLADTISLESNLPASLAQFSPAASVGVNNKAYVFGGFRSTLAPYETAETWEWDPATDTWTQKGDLVLGLGYIQATAVDGLIYAFGGTIFDGTNLVAQTKTQVFDPALGTWDDAAVAELPTAGAEGRAYSLPGQIVVSGGGQWPAETAEVYLYDIASNTYDYTFPDLNIMRRDHAGVLVPGTPDTLWVFGGRSGADTPPYAPPEYYAIEQLDPDIMVDPTFFDKTVLVDTPETEELDIMNVGGGDLDWTITEMEGHPLQGWTPEPLSGPFESGPAVEVVGDGAGVTAPVPAGNVPVYQPQDVLYDNGPLVTHPDGGYNGADASVLQTNLGLSTYGFGAQVSYNYRVADDFTVPGGGYDIDSMTFFAYQTGSPTEPPTINDVRVQIWNGIPTDPGSSVIFGDLTTNRLESVIWSGMYRVTDYDMMGNTRPPMATVATVDITLPEGTYWVEYMLGGTLSSGPWVPPVTILGQLGKPGANGLQYTTAWAALVDTGTGTVQDVPFLINGSGGLVDVPWLSEDPTSGQNDVTVAVTFDPTGMALGEYFATLVIDSNDADEPLVYVPVTMTIVEEIPIIEVDPDMLDVTVFVDEAATVDLDIMNDGEGTLDWAISEIPGVQSVTPSVQTASTPRSGRPIELSLSNGPATDIPADPWQTNGDVNLILDDGSRDNDIGIGGTWEFIWLNRFTPNQADYPFFIDEVSIWFSSVGMVNVGDDIIIVLYENTSGNYDPAVGSNYLASFPTTVQALDAWNYFTLATPVTFNGPGDVLVGVIGLEVPGTSYWPASIDQTATQQRSWAGWWLSSPPPNPPLLPPDDSWTLIDAYFPGNWMVRASGETAPVADIPWLSEDPTSGQNDVTVAVTFDPTGMSIGEYYGTLAIESNDPINPLVYIPVTMTVVEKEAGVLLTPETAAMAGDPGETVVYTLTLENTGNTIDTFTVDANSVWDVNLPVTSFELGAGETVDVFVEVLVAADAMAGDSDVATITATSAFDAGVSDSSELTTTANQVFGLELTPATAALSGAPGDELTYNLTLTNLGNGDDTVTLNLAGNLWDTELDAMSFDLMAGEEVDVIVHVTIPADAENGDTDMVTVTATSAGGPFASSELTTTATPPEGYLTVLPIVFKN